MHARSRYLKLLGKIAFLNFQVYRVDYRSTHGILIHSRYIPKVESVAEMNPLLRQTSYRFILMFSDVHLQKKALGHWTHYRLISQYFSRSL